MKNKGCQVKRSANHIGKRSIKPVYIITMEMYTTMEGYGADVKTQDLVILINQQII